MAAHVPAHFARRCVRRTAPVPYEQALAAASVSWAARAAAAAEPKSLISRPPASH